jgi:hypothetical protein
MWYGIYMIIFFYQSRFCCWTRIEGSDQLHNNSDVALQDDYLHAIKKIIKCMATLVKVKQ